MNLWWGVDKNLVGGGGAYRGGIFHRRGGMSKFSASRGGTPPPIPLSRENPGNASCVYMKNWKVTYQNQKELLNKRSELLCKCCHDNKFLLKNYTGNDFR